MKTKTKTDTVLNKAEVLLKDLEAASRGRRLRKAEAELKNAAKPKTFAGRGIALRHAEDELAPKQSEPRCIYEGMTIAKPRPAKPNAQAAIARYLRDQLAARR